jgi:solute carrier family 25 phosphate transporter 3
MAGFPVMLCNLGCWPLLIISCSLSSRILPGTLTGLQWGIYDAYKVYMGLPTTGAVEEKKK